MSGLAIGLIAGVLGAVLFLIACVVYSLVPARVVWWGIVVAVLGAFIAIEVLR